MFVGTETHNLQGLCRQVTDGTHDSPKLQESGVPFIKGKHISGGRIDFQNCDFITYADHLKVIARSKPENGDVLFSNIGSVGDTARVHSDIEFSIKNVALFKPDPQVVDSRYFFYLVSSEHFRSPLLATRSGAAQPFIGLNTLREHQVTFHSDKRVQQKIAAILSAYDDLIENNLRRIKVMEEMAQNLYREWFVKFRFPGHEQARMVDSPLGKIPEGWEVVPFSEIYGTASGGTPSRKVPEYYGGDHPWVKTRELKDGFVLKTEENITDLGLKKSSAKLFRDNTVIIAMYGATIGMLGILAMPAATNQACAAILPREKGFGRAYAFCFLIENRKELIALGQGAAQQNISQAVIKNFPSLRPPTELVGRFSDMAEPMMDSIRNLQQKNSSLRQTRDLLLPKLISGELDVTSLPVAVPDETA